MKVQKKIKKNRTKRATKKRASKKRGKGLINKLIDKLPFELHVPGYQYCGPGTHLEERLARGDAGKNPLDVACKRHDISYTNKNSEERSIADQVLQKEAMQRVFSKDASMGERATALAVAAAMRAKRGLAKFGTGLKKSNKSKKTQMAFSTLTKNVKKAIDKHKPPNTDSAIKIAIAAVKKSKSKKRIKVPRIIKLPTDTEPTASGGILPLIPIFAGLSALGSIAGSAASITNAINQARRGQRDLEENKRHNNMMEAIAIGKSSKSGNGFYLHAHKNGKGFFLKQYSKNH